MKIEERRNTNKKKSLDPKRPQAKTSPYKMR